MPTKEESIITGINPRHMLTGIVLLVFLVIAIQHGVLGAISQIQQDLIYIVAAVVFYLFIRGTKKVGLIPFDKAVLYSEQVILWYQRKRAVGVPQGEIQPTAKLRLRTYNGRPIRYEILFHILDVIDHKIRPVLVKMGCFENDRNVYHVEPKPDGWEPSEAPDYVTIAIPQGLYPQFEGAQTS